MKKMITSAATVLACSAIIATTAPTAHAASGKWQQNAKGWWYQRSDNSYPKDKWEEINGRWFYFDSQGYMLKNRWIGDYYVGHDGGMIKGAGTPDGYYVDKNGKWAKGWKLDKKGWWYERSDKSYPKDKWEEIEGVWYYFNNEGYMVHSKWVKDYYVGSNGAMLRNTITPDNYIVGPNGRWIEGVYQNQAKEVIKVLQEIQKPSSKHSKKAFLRILTGKGYSQAEAEATAASLGVDWFQHAAETYKANEIELGFYLSPKTTVVKRLTSEDYLFTESELEEAFDRLGVDWVGNATNLAKKYLADAKGEYYSRATLVKRLVEASFSEDDATKAVDGLRIDWSEEAAKAVEKILLENAQKGISRLSVMSKLTGIYGYTESEADEALTKLNINWVDQARASAIYVLENSEGGAKTYKRAELQTVLTQNYQFTEEEADKALQGLQHKNLVD